MTNFIKTLIQARTEVATGTHTLVRVTPEQKQKALRTLEAINERYKNEDDYLGSDLEGNVTVYQTGGLTFFCSCGTARGGYGFVQAFYGTKHIAEVAHNYVEISKEWRKRTDLAVALWYLALENISFFGDEVMAMSSLIGLMGGVERGELHLANFAQDIEVTDVNPICEEEWGPNEIPLAFRADGIEVAFFTRTIYGDEIGDAFAYALGRICIDFDEVPLLLR